MKRIMRLLPLIDGLLCAVLLILLLIDAIWPLADLFLNDFVKLLVLITCLCTAACGVLLIAGQRRRDRNNRWTR